MRGAGLARATLLVTVAVSAFLAGRAWQSFIYDDICLDLGGGREPGGHPICVIERN
ncbi:MAG: hypothetical protein MUC58_03700 [Rhizobiaceae bacterium]|jgi:hypothetical protein|nr:hypothetical protein [Rhizobiaceae bacterium]